MKWKGMLKIMCDIKMGFMEISPGSREERIKTQEANSGIHVSVYSTLRAPDEEYVSSADSFARSIRETPLTPEEVLGRAAAFFIELAPGD